MGCLEILKSIWIVARVLFSGATYLYIPIVLDMIPVFDEASLSVALETLRLMGIILFNIWILTFLFYLGRCCCPCCKKEETDARTPLGWVISILGWVFFLTACLFFVIAPNLETIDEKKETLKQVWFVQSAVLGMLLVLAMCNCCCCKGKEDEGERDPLLEA
jgi:hypothetical protein